MTDYISLEVLQNTVKEYFQYFFEKLYLQIDEENAVLNMRGQKADTLFAHSFYLAEWSQLYKQGVHFHVLENLKGNFVRNYETAKAAK
jgi:hypothetical protein